MKRNSGYYYLKIYTIVEIDIKKIKKQKESA